MSAIFSLNFPFLKMKTFRYSEIFYSTGWEWYQTSALKLVNAVHWKQNIKYCTLTLQSLFIESVQHWSAMIAKRRTEIGGFLEFVRHINFEPLLQFLLKTQTKTSTTSKAIIFQATCWKIIIYFCCFTTCREYGIWNMSHYQPVKFAIASL